MRAGLIAAWPLAVLLAAPLIARAATDAGRIERVLAQTPLIDGHNDLPWEIRARFGGDLAKIDLAASTAALPAPPDGVPLMTDIPPLRAGRVGAQFWSVWIPVDVKGA
ncbi:MAG: membrane dipeptidase, partial [Gammaproteobacteria bacterium]